MISKSLDHRREVKHDRDRESEVNRLKDDSEDFYNTRSTLGVTPSDVFCFRCRCLEKLYSKNLRINKLILTDSPAELEKCLENTPIYHDSMVETRKTPRPKMSVRESKIDLVKRIVIEPKVKTNLRERTKTVTNGGCLRFLKVLGLQEKQLSIRELNIEKKTYKDIRRSFVVVVL